MDLLESNPDLRRTIRVGQYMCPHTVIITASNELGQPYSFCNDVLMVPTKKDSHPAYVVLKVTSESGPCMKRDVPQKLRVAIENFEFGGKAFDCEHSHLAFPPTGALTLPAVALRANVAPSAITSQMLKTFHGVHHRFRLDPCVYEEVEVRPQPQPRVQYRGGGGAQPQPPVQHRGGGGGGGGAPLACFTATDVIPTPHHASREAVLRRLVGYTIEFTVQSVPEEDPELVRSDMIKQLADAGIAH